MTDGTYDCTQASLNSIPTRLSVIKSTTRNPIIIAMLYVNLLPFLLTWSNCLLQVFDTLDKAQEYREYCTQVSFATLFPRWTQTQPSASPRIWSVAEMPVPHTLTGNCAHYLKAQKKRDCRYSRQVWLTLWPWTCGVLLAGASSREPASGCQL